MAGEGIIDGGVRVGLVAAPEEATATTGSVGVVVSGGGTETPLALVVTSVEDLEEDGEEEEETTLLAQGKQTRIEKRELTFQ